MDMNILLRFPVYTAAFTNPNWVILTDSIRLPIRADGKNSHPPSSFAPVSRAACELADLSYSGNLRVALELPLRTEPWPGWAVARRGASAVLLDELSGRYRDSRRKAHLVGLPVTETTYAMLTRRPFPFNFQRKGCPPLNGCLYGLGQEILQDLIWEPGQ